MLIRQKQRAKTLHIGHKILGDAELNFPSPISREVYHTLLRSGTFYWAWCITYQD